MDIYHGFFSLKSGVSDVEFAGSLGKFMEYLKSQNKIAKWRLMRRKLGLGPSELGEFHIMIEVEGLAQLDEAFSTVATRSGDVESLHFGVNSKIDSIKFALFRDFPDQIRMTGEEKF